MQQTTVRTYKGQSEFERDAKRLAEQGWEVKTVTSQQPRSGCLRIIALGGIGALVFKPKPVVIVTYTRAA